MNLADLSRLLLLIALGVGVATGCQTLGASQESEPAPQAERVPPAPAAAEVAGGEPAEPGMLPSSPLPRGAAIKLPSVQVEVTDLQRADSALRMLRAASPTNRPPPQGSEYVLVHLSLTGLAPPKSWVGCKDFRVIGADRIAYFHSSQIPPAPELKAGLLKEEERTEGWCVYSVHANERSLILMVSISDARFPRERRYLALEPGAALAPAPIAAAPASPQSAGESPLSAAAPGQEVLTQDWSVTVVEIRRGDAARRLVENANSRNPAPADGREFVAVKLRARYRGRTEHPALLSRAAFRTINSDGKPYENPIVFDVAPRLNRMLLPGGEHTGWAVFQVAPGDTRAVLRFQPLYPDRDRRYFALVESARFDELRSE